MTIMEEITARQNLESFLETVIKKYYTDCQSAAVELVSWIDTECIKTGYGRIGFYACVAIAEVCWKIWDEDIYQNNNDNINYDKLITKILNIIRRNDSFDSIDKSDAELFEIWFFNFAY